MTDTIELTYTDEGAQEPAQAQGIPRVLITNVHDFVPAEREDEIISLGEQISSNQWRIADLVNMTCRDIEAATLQGARVEIGRMQVYSYFAQLIGKSSSSLRRWCAVADFYNDESRAQFAELPFEHFKFAMRFPDKWSDILSLSISMMRAQYGKPPSVDWLEAKFTDTAQVDAGIDGTMDELNSSEELENLGRGGKIDAGVDLSPEDAARVQGVLKHVGVLLETARRSMKILPDPLLEPIDKAMFQLERAILDAKARV